MKRIIADFLKGFFLQLRYFQKEYIKQRTKFNFLRYRLNPFEKNGGDVEFGNF